MECPVILSCGWGRSRALVGCRPWSYVCIRTLLGETFKVWSWLKCYCIRESTSLLRLNHHVCLSQKLNCLLFTKKCVIWCEATVFWHAYGFFFEWLRLTRYSKYWGALSLHAEGSDTKCWQATCQMPSEDFCRHHPDIYRENSLACSGSTPGIR